MRKLDVKDFGSAPAEDLLAYPGESPSASFLYRQGELFALDAAPAEEVDEYLNSFGDTPLAARLAVLCLGSNANPSQIHHKVRHDPKPEAIPLLRTRVQGVRPVYAGHVGRYGAIPATGEAGAAMHHLFLAFYTAAQLAATFHSEHPNYHFCRLDGVIAEVPPAARLERPYAFLSKKGVLTLAEDKSTPLEHLTQEEILRIVLERTGLHLSMSFEAYIANIEANRQSLDDAIAIRQNGEDPRSGPDRESLADRCRLSAWGRGGRPG